MEKTRNYETMFVIKPDADEDTREEVIERFKGIITDNEGEINEVDTWGTRELAYEINDYRSGYYTVINFNGKTSIVDELEYDFKIVGEILRHLIVRKED